MPRIATQDSSRTEAAARIRTPDRRLRVFISSTLGELADERQSARAAVEQLRLTPIMFELGARPHPPRVLYRSYLAQSEVFVGIYWQRYGWVAPNMDVSGLEDELLLSDGMPRLIYVKRPAPEIEPRLEQMLGRLQDEDRASYRPFRDAAELRELLLDDLAVLLSERFEHARAVPAHDRAASSLPAPTSTFFGREQALDSLGALLGDGAIRLVTLVGPGGTGKTRLALEAARAQVDRFPDGVHFVDLSAERQPEEVFAAIARGLDIGGTREGPALDALEHDLRDRRMLLVLDNFEQVVAAGAGVVQLLAHCPFLQVIVTSREALRVSGERVFAVPPLTLPITDQSAGSVDALLRSEAGRLFVDRAAAAGSSFVVTADNAADVIAVCRLLDGLPLAIELGAARMKVFAIDDLRAELERRHEVLTAGARDLPARQQTLRKTLEWSHDLLTADERTMFGVFSVFADARLIDVEEAVRLAPTVPALDVVEAMSSLVDKSLVRMVEGDDGRPRCSMLQTIRQYGRERLEATPELAEDVRRAHAEHYTTRALELHRRLTYVDRADVLSALGADLANVRAAWDHWVERADHRRLGELLEPLWGYFDARGDYRAAIVLGEDFLRVLSQLPDTPERRYDEFAVQTNLARTQLAVGGFTGDAERKIRDALERYEVIGDSRQRFSALRSLASLQLMRAEFERTTAVANDLMDIAEKESDAALLSEAHLFSCLTTGWTDDLLVAIEHADRAVAEFRTAASGFVAFRVGPNPGVVADAVSGLFRWMAGFPDGAVSHLDAALRLARELDHPPSVAYALHHANVVDLWRMDSASVIRRSDELLDVADTHGYPTWRALALVLQGAAMVQSGATSSGLVRIDEGFTLYNELTTPPIFWPTVLMMRASAYRAAGQVERAVELMRESETLLHGYDPLLADLAISHGDLLLGLPTPDVTAAEARFEDAASIAGSRRARMVVLQALTRLVAVRQGERRQETLHQLGELYDWFTEGFDSPQLTAARALLEDAS